MTSLSSTLQNMSLSRTHVLGMLLALLVGLYLIQTLVTRKETDRMAKSLSSFYPRPLKQAVESFRRIGSAVEQWRDEQTGKSPSPKGCSEKSHIVFLKTQQTESATIQNILYRYGESRKLTFALPEKSTLRFSYPELFQSRFVEGVHNDAAKKFDILCNEMRFRKSEVSKVMPKDTFYFSMVRHPVLMMQAMFMVFKYISCAGDSHTLDAMIKDRMAKYSPADISTEFLFSNLTFDFGFDNVVAKDRRALKKRAEEVIANIERDFDLILINEYFDESLILLKHALCWSLEDLVTFRRSSRSDQPTHEVLPDTAEEILKWNAVDWEVYQYFNTTFWNKVESVVGIKKMKKEVAELRELQAKMTAACLKGRYKKVWKGEFDLQLDWKGGDISLGFNINQNLDNKDYRMCQKLLTPAVQFTSNLYDLQFSKADHQKKQTSV